MTETPISNGVPGPGAGNLETKASHDLYNFTVPAGGKSLFLDFTGCASNNISSSISHSWLKWQVTAVGTGARIAGDYCRNGDKTVALPEGEYTLDISAEQDSYGTYTLKGTLA